MTARERFIWKSSLSANSRVRLIDSRIRLTVGNPDSRWLRDFSGFRSSLISHEPWNNEKKKIHKTYYFQWPSTPELAVLTDTLSFSRSKSLKRFDARLMRLFHLRNQSREILVWVPSLRLCEISKVRPSVPEKLSDCYWQGFARHLTTSVSPTKSQEIKSILCSKRFQVLLQVLENSRLISSERERAELHKSLFILLQQLKAHFSFPLRFEGKHNTQKKNRRVLDEI